jgi:hypothetical protein
MSHRGAGLWATFAALALGACAGVGVWLAVVSLPGILAPPPDLDEDNPSVTWLGQGVAAAYGLGFLLLVLLYTAKRCIVRFAPSVPAALAWYGLAVACSLPYIWFLVVLDWQNPFVYRLSCWLYNPVGILAVPTLSFTWDVARRTAWPWQAYLARSLVEIVVVIPIWLVCWLFFSFFFLGGGWI